MPRASRLVTGKFIVYTEDGPDAGDQPDRVALEGLVVQFKPSVPRVVDLTVPETTFLRTVTGVTNEYGELVDSSGAVGLRVPVTDPENFTYRVSIIPPDGSYVHPYLFDTLIPYSPLPFDITTAVPAPGNPSQDLAAWLAVVAQVTNLRDQAVAAVISIDDRIKPAVAEALADPEITNTISDAADAAVGNALDGVGVLRVEDSSSPNLDVMFTRDGKKLWLGFTQSGGIASITKWALVNFLRVYAGAEPPYVYRGNSVLWIKFTDSEVSFTKVENL